MELTCDTDTHIINGNGVIEKEIKTISFLDVEVFKHNNNIETCEHRKETSAKSYLNYDSAHPRHTFGGIIKSQLYRSRRLCSRQIDFETSVSELRKRCMNSGYPLALINKILDEAPNLSRTLSNVEMASSQNGSLKYVMRLVVLAGTQYENEFDEFASRMNTLMSSSAMKVEIVKSTSLSLSQFLFNNCDKVRQVNPCVIPNCIICDNNMNKGNIVIKSTTSGKEQKVNVNLDCSNGGIYIVTGGCFEQYTGKTTTTFSNRIHEHFMSSKTSTVFQHKENCNDCSNPENCSIGFIENYLDRGKYSLSEREYLWNYRFKGTMNIQKTLKS